MKAFHDKIFDNGLNHGKNNGNKMVLCKAIPTTYLEAVNTPGDAPPGYNVSGAGVALAPADIVIADKVGGGREATVAAKSGTVSHVTTGGDNLHIAVVDTVNSDLLIVTDETTDQVLTVSNPINFPSWKFGHNDPV